MLHERPDHLKNAPGIYTFDERVDKILKCKGKIRKHRSYNPVNRSFRGRSKIAVKKPRIKGKFVTPEEYTEYLKTQVKKDEDCSGSGRIWGGRIIDDINLSTSYNDSEKSFKDLIAKEEA